MGLALGAVFVPCAGPVLAAIIVAGSTGRIGLDTVLLTVSFAVGVAIPLLFFALAGRGLVERIRAFRTHERGLRIAAGIAMLALAVGLVFNVPQLLQRLVPDYTADIQRDLTDSSDARRALDLGGLVTDENKDLDKCTNGAAALESCGTAPSIMGIDQWLNTPDGAAVDLADLRGEVVLVDFWAYSCINCQRSIPHVVAWDAAYRDAGLRVIGIHSPEYAFEKDAANVAAGAKAFGITYPVGLDNDLSTWTNYRNRYWPAHYLIDAEGTVRHISFGEGSYAATEKLIRDLLVGRRPGRGAARRDRDRGRHPRGRHENARDVPRIRQGRELRRDRRRTGRARVTSRSPQTSRQTRSRWTGAGASRLSTPVPRLTPAAASDSISVPRKCAWCSRARAR